MRLRSGKLRRNEEGNSGVERVDIPDLNLIDDGDDVVSGEKGVSKSDGVSGVEGKSNGEVLGGEITASDEVKRLKIDNEGSVHSLASSVSRVLRTCFRDVDNSDGRVGQGVVGGDGKEVGEEGLSCASGLASGNACSNSAVVVGSDVSRSHDVDEKKVVDEGKDVEMKERGPEDVGIDDDSCGEGLAATAADVKYCAVADISASARVDGNLKSDVKEDRVEACKKRSANEGFQSRCAGRESGERVEGEARDERIQSVGRVLRSRIVPANGLGGKAGVTEIRATPSKRKRETRDCEDLEVSVEEEITDSAVNSKVVGSRGRPKGSVSHSNRGVSELKKVKHIPEAQNESVDNKSVSSSVRKRKRGRPKKYVDHPDQQAAEMDEVDVASEVVKEELSHISAASLEEGEYGREKTIDCPKEKDVVKVDDEAGDVSQKSGGSSLVRRSGRPRRIVDYSEREVLQRKNASGRKVSSDEEDEEDEEDENPSNISITVPTKKGKRGRPKKGGNATLQMALSEENIAKDQNTEVSPATETVRRCRQDSGRQIVVPEKPNGRVSSRKGIYSDKKVRPKIGAVETSCKGQEASSSSPRKGMRGSDVPGSLAAEKNAVRIQIVDMLLAAGWTVEYRPRNGRDYKDAVYVNHEGKTHWSVTKAYFQLKHEFEEGKVSSFTPLPEELLAKLFRVVSKKRSDAQKTEKPVGGGESGRNRKHSSTKGKSTRDWSEIRRRCCALVARRSKGSNSEKDVAIAHSGKHSILAWMIDSGVIKSDWKVQYMNRRKTKALLEGSITRDGINCHCCKEVFSISEFEKHAGGKLCQPYENLYLESGQSLLQCQLETWSKQKAVVGYHSFDGDVDDPNDDTCAICGDGGDLMCCDTCPSTFHHDCLDIEEIPSGEWHCVFCSCKYCGAGDSTTDSTDDGDTASSSMVACSVCEEKYHRRCADEEDAVQVKSGGVSFCGKDCEKIFEGLQRLIGVKRDLEDGFSWTLLQRSDVKAEAVPSEPKKIVTNSKLAVALSVMDECFMPIIDPRSGINLIRHVVYNCGSNFTRVNFSSFFTVVLEKGDEVIAAASIRIHGKQLAEMPFIGTRNSYRRQGMCRRLLSAIEVALGSLNVENLVIPAIPELLDTWTSVFGFKPLKDSVREGMKSMNMLVFAHTDMLQKPISKHIFVEKGISIIENDANCCKSLNEQLDGGPDMSEVDDGCLNTEIDLNVVAPNIPESSSDERHGNAGQFEDEVKSRMDSEQLLDVNKVEGQQSVKENGNNQVETSAIDSGLLNDANIVECMPSVKENGNDQVENSDVDSGLLNDANIVKCQPSVKENGNDQVDNSDVVNTSEGRALQPDLNVTETMCEDSVSPKLLEGSSCVSSSGHPCPAAVNAGESAKSIPTSHGLTKLEPCSVLVIGSDNNGHSSVNPDLNLMGDHVSDNDGCLPPNLADHAKGHGLPEEINCHNIQISNDGPTIRPCSLKISSEGGLEHSDVIASDDHCSGTVAFLADCEDDPTEVKDSLKCKILETNKPFSWSGNEVSSYGSMLNGEQLHGNFVGCSESDSRVQTNDALVNPKSLCNTSSVAGSSSITGLCRGSDVPKVGMN